MLELDPNLQALIIAGLTVLVTEGLKALSGVLHLDLSGAAAAVTAGFVALVLAVLSGVLALVPPEYHQVAQVVMALIVAILGSFGFHRQLKRFEPNRG
jgi:putative exporter of polyketide antibiotics